MPMEYFLAKSDRQLGICLRLLYANGIQGHVKTVLNSKMRIEFHIRIAEMERFEELDAQYRIQIS